jgi:hypothetical protein
MGARVGVYNPETQSIVLLSDRERLLTQCAVILTLNDEIIDKLNTDDGIFGVLSKRGEVTKKIDAACTNGKAAEWVLRYLYKTSGQRRVDSKIISEAFTPEEFLQTFGVHYNNLAHNYLNKTLIENRYCGLNEYYTDGEMLSVKAKISTLFQTFPLKQKERRTNNFIINHFDLWLQRQVAHWRKADNLNENNKLQKIQSKLSFVEKLDSISSKKYTSELIATLKEKRSYIAKSHFESQIKEKYDLDSVTLIEIGQLVKITENQKIFFNYLSQIQKSEIKKIIYSTINKRAVILLKNQLRTLVNDRNSISLINFNKMYGSIFSYLSKQKKQEILALLANYQFTMIINMLSAKENNSKTLINLLYLANYHDKSKDVWLALSDAQKLGLNKVRKEILEDYAYQFYKELDALEFYEFYHGEGKNLFQYINPVRQDVLLLSNERTLPSQCTLISVKLQSILSYVTSAHIKNELERRSGGRKLLDTRFTNEKEEYKSLQDDIKTCRFLTYRKSYSDLINLNKEVKSAIFFN